MGALRFSTLLALSLFAASSFGRVSNPYEIVESSQVSDDRLVAAPAPAATTASAPKGAVDQMVDKATQAAKQVQGWLESRVKSFWGAEKTEGQQAGTSPTPPPTALLSRETSQTAASIGSQTSIETEAAALAASMPSAAVDKTKRMEALKEAKNKLKTEGVVISSSGRKGSTSLKTNAAGVPVFPLEVKKTLTNKDGKTKTIVEKVKSLPRLDIGEESRVTKRDFLLKDYQLPTVALLELPKLRSPEFISQSDLDKALKQQITLVTAAADMDKAKFGIDKIITRDSIAKTQPIMKSINEFQEKPYRELSPDELQMLSALILLNKSDNCTVLLGLFDDLSRKESFKDEANFHLGVCALKSKLYSAAFDRLSTLIKAENASFAAEALETLVSDLPLEFEVAFSRLVRGIKNTGIIRPKIRDEVNYYTAKGAMQDDEFGVGRTYAEKIPATSKRYANAQYMIGVAWYALGKSDKAVTQMETLRQWMAEKKWNDKTLNSLTAVNLARIYFNSENYKKAHSLYMAVDKDHPLWVQALIEQGWAQLGLDDFSGAIGNMYSLHSPYFKVVYKPESFVVRTIGYLNICQYGDAYKTLTWMEQEYRPWLDKVNGYTARVKTPTEYYETTIKYLRGRSMEDIDGLPPQVLREMARQREFLNYQTSLNEKSDEDDRYESVNKSIRQHKARLKARMQKANDRYTQAKANIAKASGDRALAGQVPQWRAQMKIERDLVMGFRHQIAMMEESRKYYDGFHKDVILRTEKEKLALRTSAGKNLAQSLGKMKKEMSLILENNEFLRYEVFAGSGENIRYQVAGGSTAEANRIPASVKPTKSLNWNFDGEYWEDEIGSYRSSLKNNCPNIGKMDNFFKDQKSKDNSSGQAALERGVGQ